MYGAAQIEAPARVGRGFVIEESNENAPPVEQVQWVTHFYGTDGSTAAASDREPTALRSRCEVGNADAAPASPIIAGCRQSMS